MQALHYTLRPAAPPPSWPNASPSPCLTAPWAPPIQRFKLGEAQYRGEGYNGRWRGDRFKDFPRDVKGNNELLSLTRLT